MSQTRYYHRTDRPSAEAAYAALETAFEDEGAPVAIAEIDEARQIFEVSVYLMSEEGSDTERREAFARIAGLSSPEDVGVEVLPDKDWMADVLAVLKPVRAGRFLVHGAHDRDKIRSGDLAVEIEAGQAFGTGHHGTTAGCLAMIDREVGRRRPANTLDLGTGSAVLAIALAKRARIPVLATDIDPVAVRVARGNVAGNGVSRLVTCAVADGLDSDVIRSRAPFDFIVANILAGPLKMLAPGLAQVLAQDGRIILSGILKEQRWSVLAAYRSQGLVHRRTIALGEWVTLLLSR